MGLQPAARSTALILKLIVTVTGAIAAVLSLAFVYDAATNIAQAGVTQVGLVVATVASLAVVMSSTSMISSIPQSVRARFRRRPKEILRRPIYGFVTVLAVGIGSTIGSPLFVLIPLNIIQYEFVSLGSLVLASVLSVLMAKVYANMYVESSRRGLKAVGGPSFTQLAVGTRSARYFFSRVSMWIANTALAAYSKIVFVIFDVEILPKILSSFGIGTTVSLFIVYSLAVVFIGWSVVNAVFERRILRSVGYLQIVLTVLMVLILVYQGLLLGARGGWDLTGITQFTSGNWLAALVINTGYLYLLFFGFQEIQALELDAHEESKIPIVSWIRRGYRMKRSGYLGLAMVLSVLVAAIVNILYALAVYSLHPSLSSLNSSQIPALFISKGVLGSGQELLTAVAFLTATITTFVPAFVAASRHLGALGEDGYIPHSIANFSWVFTLGAIVILALGNADFLVEITDFLVLISLGIITLSAVWLKSGEPFGRGTILPIAVGASCFVAGASIYFIDSGVVIFGVAAVAFTYLVFDITELGALGTNLFLSVFNMVCLVLLSLLSVGTGLAGPALNFLGLPSSWALPMLTYLLLICSGMLVLNMFVDVRILKVVRSVT